MYRVVVGEIVATGKGPSKKKAKHNAAQEALEKIREVVASAAGQDMSQVRSFSGLFLAVLFLFYSSSACPSAGNKIV